MLVHGDDYLSSGQSKDLDWLKGELEKAYEIQTQRVGGGSDRDQEGKILNRIVRWTEKGFELEADPRHAELVIRQLEIEKEKSLSSPGVDDTSKDDDDGLSPLSPEQATMFRGIAASINYLSPDRPDILYAAKEACRDMANPNEGSWKKLVRIGRYLLGRPRLVWHFEMQEHTEFFDAFSDAD